MQRRPRAPPSNSTLYREATTHAQFLRMSPAVLRGEWARDRTTAYWRARTDQLRNIIENRRVLIANILQHANVIGEVISPDYLEEEPIDILINIESALGREREVRRRRERMRADALARRKLARSKYGMAKERLSTRIPLAPIAPQIPIQRQPVDRIPMPIPTVNRILGGISYVNKNINEPSSSASLFFKAILKRINNAMKRYGMTRQSIVHVKFMALLDSGSIMPKQFTFLISEWDKFKRAYRSWVECCVIDQPNYEYDIVELSVLIIQENRGGCRTRCLTQKQSSVIFHWTKSSSNNCLFTCLLKLGILPVDRIGKVYANRIRKKHNIPDNEPIPLSVARKIVKSECTAYVDIIDSTLGIPKIVGGDKAIRLADGHYTIAESRIEKQCNVCLRKYYNTHKCNSTRTQYANKIMGNGVRSLLCRKIQKEPINDNMLVHYDIETYINYLGEHTPYIVGVSHRGTYTMHAGQDCMVNFIRWVLSLEYEVILNAFNGSKFDAFPLYSALLGMGLHVKDFIINNNSLLKLRYANFSIFDTCKHTVGSLKSNLQAFGCNTQKGDFDHSKACQWELMPDDMKEECVKYLKADVLGLRELYEKINGSIHEAYGTNITNYISTSQLTFSLYKDCIRGKHYISLPTLASEAFFRRAIFGGRVYPSKRRFMSESYIDYVNGKVSFDDIKDYCIDADVVSLYPASMANNLYPVGKENMLEEKYCNIEYKAYDVDSFINRMPGALGIYEVSFITNKTLAHPIVGNRQGNGSLQWNLSDTEYACHSSVAIIDMIANGYTVKIHRGYYWDRAEPVFKEYIDVLFKKKERLASEGKKGSAEYHLSKLLMNGLYGKCIQRPVREKTACIYSNHEFWNFWGEHAVDSISQVGDGFHVSGTPRNFLKQEASITKPTHLGVFVLDYSRRIMLEYFKQSNPHFNRELSGGSVAEQINGDMFYTDTDSIQMNISSASRIPQLGGSNLGDIQDDLGSGCKIIRGVWIAPKLYSLEYIRRNDPKGHINYHFRGKGLNKEQLSAAIFDQMDDGYIIRNTREFQMKRIGVKRNNMQKEHSIFTILHETNLIKFVNSNKWAGRYFVDENNSIPHGATIN